MAELVDLALRTTSAALETAASTATVVAETSPCSDRNDFDGRIGLRISALFVMLIGSLCGKTAGHEPLVCA